VAEFNPPPPHIEGFPPPPRGASTPVGSSGTAQTAEAPPSAPAASVVAQPAAPGAPAVLGVAVPVSSVFSESSGAQLVLSASIPGNGGSLFADGIGLASVTSGQTGYASNGWHVVPSAANEYGPGPGEHEFKIDLAGDVLQDWYFV
jgi:hypothetical protein